MQNKFDYMDKIIANSKEDLKVPYDYNVRLLKKLNKSKKHYIFNKPVAASFIISGIIIGALNVNFIAYNLFTFKNNIRIQEQICLYEYENKVSTITNEIGEWF